MRTEIKYRNNNLKIVTEQQFGQRNFGGYRDFLENDKLRIREQYIGNHLFEIRYYKNSNEDDNQIIEKFVSTPGLKRFDIRVRESYGDFWIDKIKYYDLAENQFYSFQVRELYNNKGQCIASERINQSLISTDENYRELVKYYYNSDNGSDGEYFISRFINNEFEYIKHFEFGFDTDSQDVEQYSGNSAEQLMIGMGIPPKMRAWYVNNEFLPEL